MLDAEQLHISITAENRITISWASPGKQVAHLNIEENDNKIEKPWTQRIVIPTESKYDFVCGRLERRNCRFTGKYSSPLLLHAEVLVAPASEYRYRLSLNSGNTSTQWRRFRTPPAVGTRKLRIAVVGDLGQSSFSAETCKELAKRHAEETIDVAVLVGDLAYADTDARRWDSFGRHFDENGCSEIPWLVMPGNHEIDVDDVSGEPFVPYRFRWRTPEVAGEQVGKAENGAHLVEDWGSYSFRLRYDFGASFYSIRLGSAHFIVLNPYTEAGEQSAQLTWLRTELKNVNRSNTNYLIVFAHSPWRHTSLAHLPKFEKATRQLMTSAEPLLVNAGVDMFFSGHLHAYERSKPVQGIRHFVVGHGGNYEGLYDRWTDSDESACSDFRSGDHYGFGVLHLQDDTATWKAVNSKSGSVVDELKMMAGPAGLLEKEGTHACNQLTLPSLDNDMSAAAGSNPWVLAIALSATLIPIAFVVFLIRYWCITRRALLSISQDSEERTSFKGVGQQIGNTSL